MADAPDLAAPAAATPAANWLLEIAYRGSAYAGWQYQPDQPTVQGILEARLSGLYRQPVHVHGCSRTDAGVHALAQCATLRPPLSPPIPAGGVLTALRHSLPADIRLLSLVPRPADFHARYDNIGKAYTYVLHRGTLTSPFIGDLCWPLTHALDLAPMREAAELLTGEHDFTTFSAVGADHLDPIRRLDGFSFFEHQAFLAVTVRGNSFLYRMVRRLVGYLVEVGRQRLAPAETPAVLAARDRNAHFDTAPAQGLYLAKVFFPGDDPAAYRPDHLPFLDFL